MATQHPVKCGILASNKNEDIYIKPLFVDDIVSDLIHLNKFEQKDNTDYCKYLSTLGIKLRKGFWTEQEDQKLLENFKNYVKNHPIENERWLFTRRFKTNLRKKFLNTDFYSQLTANLNRSTSSVYYRAKYLFERKKVGKFEEEEIVLLKELVQKYGTDWLTISEIMQRPVNALKYHYSKENCLEGRWSKEEEFLLLQAVKRVTKCDDLLKVRKYWRRISFLEVSKYVKTRNSMQCLQHFKRIKKWQLQTDLDTEKWGKKHSLRLVKLLYDGDFQAEDDIDWPVLNESFIGISPSVGYLKRKYSSLKYSVEDYQRKSLTDLVECLKKQLCEKD